MVRQLGHRFPLGAFRNLGSWVQRRSLGTSSLSILDLKTFYPQGFPAVSTESSANEPQPSTSADNAVARKSDTSSPTLDTQISSSKRAPAPDLDTQVLSDKKTPDPDLDTQVLSDKRAPNPVSRKQSTPFRASLQRYFKPETGVATADVSLSQKGGANPPALANQVTAQPDLANSSTPDLQSASDPASTVEPAANISSTELSFPNVIERSKTSGDNALQRSVTEDIQTDKSGSSQPSVADITHSIQSLQPSSSMLQANTIDSDLQRTTDIANSPSISSSIRSSSVEPNTLIPAQQLAQQPGLASTDINQSIQSLREPSASLQRSTGQHNQNLEQHSDLRTQPELESQAPPTTSPQLETQTAQQPKASAPSIQRLNESTETSSSSLSPNQNPGTVSIHNQGQPLQRQSDSTTAAVPNQIAPKSGPVQQSTEQNAIQPPNSETAAIPNQAELKFGPVQRATEQNATTLEQQPSSGNDRWLNTHARCYTASNQLTTVPDQLNVSPKIQTALESSQTPSSPTSSNSNTVQQQPASRDPVNIDNSPPDNPTLNNLPQVQLTSSQQHTSQLSGAALIESISNKSTITHSTESVQRIAESAQSPTSDSLDPSSVSAQNLDSIQPVSDIAVKPAVNLPQAATSTPLVSAIQRTPDQSHITSERLADDGNDNPIQSVTHQEIQSVTNPSAPSSDQIAPSADIQRVSETTSTPAQSKPTSDNLEPLQRQPNIVAEGSTNPGNSLAVDSRLELPQPNATAPTLDSGNGSSDITDPPDVSSKPTASVQRSTAELKDDQSSSEQPISQEQADAIAPHPTKINQTSAHTEIQRSPNLSDTATNFTTDKSSSDTESVTSNVQSVANSVESIQRTADTTQSSKVATDDTIQTDITQLAADNLSETSIIETPNDSQPAASSAKPVQQVVELHQSAPSTPNPNQTLELQQVSSVPAESIIGAPSEQNTLQRHTKPPQVADISEVPTKATVTVSNDKNTTALSETVSASDTVSDSPKNTLQRHTKLPTSTDKTELQPESAATVSNNQDTVALSETLSTEVGESVTTTSNLSSTLQRQTDSFQSADIPPAQTESAAHISGNQEAIEQSNVTSHLTRDVFKTSASSRQAESLQRQTDAPISHASSPPEIQQAPEPDGLDIPLSSNVQHSLSTVAPVAESDQPTSQSLTTQKAADPSKDTSITPAKSQSTSESQSWSPEAETPLTDPSTVSIQRVAVESRQNELSDSNLSESKQRQSTSSDPSDIQRAVSSDSRSYQNERSDVLSSSPELTQPTDTRRVQPFTPGDEVSTERSASLLQCSPNITSDPIDATIPLSEPGSKISSDSATTQRLSDNASDTVAPPSLSAQPSKPRQQEHRSSSEGPVTLNPEITNQDVPNAVVQRSTNTAVTDSSLPLGEPLSNKAQLSHTSTHSPAAKDSLPPDAVSVQRAPQAGSRQEASSYLAPKTQNVGDGETHHSQQSGAQEAVNQYSSFEKSRKPLTTLTKTHSADISETSTSSSQSKSLQRQTDAPVSKPTPQISTPPEIQQDSNTTDIPLSSEVQRSLSATDSVTASNQPASESLTIQKAVDLSKDTSATPVENQSRSESQPWSPDIEAPPTASSKVSIQRVASKSLQTDVIQSGEAQSFESQPGQAALENIQRISDIRKTDFSKPTIESSQIDKNELSDSNLSEFKQSQSTSSDSSDIQRAISLDSRSYKENPSDGLTSSPELTQPADTTGIQPFNSSDEVSVEKIDTPLQRSSNINSNPIETTIRLSGNETSADTAATQQLSDSVSDTIDSTKKLSDSLGPPSKTLQQEQSTSSRESATSDPGITNQEVSARVVQRTPNTSVENRNLSLGEPLSNKAQLSDTDTHSLSVTDSLQSDAVSVQRAPQAGSRQEASSYPAPKTQNVGDGETHHSQQSNTQEAANQYSVFEKPLKPLTATTETRPATVSEPTSAPNTESSPHINSPSTSIQRSSKATRQPQSSTPKTSLQRLLDGDSQPESTTLAGKSLPHKVLGSSSSNRSLPRVLQPLGVLKPLPSLRTTKSAPAPSVSPQTQLNTVQRQAIANEWAKNISSQEATSYSSPHPTNPGSFQSSPSQDLAIPHMPNLENVNNSIEDFSDTNSTAANIQQASADTHSSIQRRSDSDNIPSEWSNLEDLVTHLQSTPPNQVSAKVAPTQQQPNTNKPTTKVAPQSEPQTVKLPKPATVTVQRQAGPPSTTKPTVIQACKDTSPDADSANTNEQTDENFNYSQYLELLAQEVYGLLRQRLSLEQERRGPKYPR